MKPIKTFKVFGEPIEILVSGEMTGGLSTTLIQTSPPGGGPPPHSHANEDETFYVLEGNYELLQDGQWVKAAAGECVQTSRGSFHTFRNAGTTTGRMLVFVAPAGLDKYLEELSAFKAPDDMAAILALSARYGIALS
ncbi:MAG: cupin domain-containing protein [Terracidiphilus sp.]